MNKNIILLITIISLVYSLPNHLTSFTKHKSTSDNTIINKYCNGQSSLTIPQSQYTTNSQYFQTLSSYFNIDPIQVITLAHNFTLSNVLNKIHAIQTGLIIYIGAFVLGLVIILFIWICLCCCLARSSKKRYSTCQRWWPIIFLILISLASIIIGIIGIVKPHDIKNSTNDFQCSIGLVFDTLNNGATFQNYTFMGINGFSFNLENITQNISSLIDTQTITLNNQIGLASNNITNGLSHTQLLTGTVNTSLTLAYNNPTPALGAPAVISSLFDQVLGNPTISNSLSGQLYSNLQTGNSQISTTLTPFINDLQTEKSNFNNSVSPILLDIQTYTNNIQNSESNVMTTLDTIDTYLNSSDRYAIIMYIVATVTSALSIFSILVILYIGKSVCRYLFYLNCSIIWILGIATFVISIVLGATIPLFYLSCDLINGAIQNSTQLTNIFSQLNINLTYADAINTCISGDGNFINYYVNTTDLLNQINSSIVNINNNIQNSTFDNSTIISSWNNLTQTIINFNEGYQNDLAADPPTLNWFAAVSNGSQYAGNCSTDPNFIKDNLVPSTSTLVTQNIPCTLPAASCTTIDTCSNGCIGINQMMAAENGNVTSFSNHIQARYSGSCGIQISKDFSQLFNNWYTPRRDITTGIQSVYDRYTNPGSSLNDDIQNLLTTINTIENQFQNLAGVVINDLNSQLDPATGLLAQANCRPFGEDVKMLVDSVCVVVFNKLYLTFVFSGLISFVSLFSMCMITMISRRNIRNEDNNYRRMADDSINSVDS